MGGLIFEISTRLFHVTRQTPILSEVIPGYIPMSSTSTTPSAITIILRPTMADAAQYDEPSLADDFEEGFYDGNDDDSCIVVEDGTKADDGERVIKLSFSSLIRFHRRNPTIKAHFIDIVQKFVINNTEIAVRASMLLHYIVMDCIRTNSELPEDFCSRRFIGQVINFTKQPPLLSDEAIAAYCSSDTCRSHRYLNRDDVGCYNIYRKSRIEFPEIMERGQPGWEDAASIHEFRPMF